VGEFGFGCSKFSMVDALDIRGRRGVVSAPKSKLPRCGAEEGRRVGKGGRGVEGGGLAPRMTRRDLCVHKSTCRGHQVKTGELNLRELPMLPLLRRPMILASSDAKPVERGWEKSFTLPLLLRFCL